MAEISAKQVQALREKTGLPMMDVKKALVEANGDEAKAIEILKKRFADKMMSKADRVAAKGRIGAYAGTARGALVEARCETDFVATNDVFRAFADSVARQVVETGIVTIPALMASHAAFAGGRPMQTLLEETFSKLGEKLEIAQAVMLDGSCATYVHHNGQVGAIIATDKAQPEFGKQACMHVASQQGEVWMSREQVPAGLVATERERAKADVQGKPPQIIDKIVEGKLGKWFAERVLPEQPFVLDDKRTVGQAAKDAGVTLTGFCRLEVGRVGS